MKFYGSGLLKSMVIAFRNFMRPPITLQYPHQKMELPERSRWAVRMKYDEDGNHKCTACLACERACPDFIIQIDVTTGEDRSKQIDRWHYQLGGCMMCGLCVEACPFDAILMSHEYELACVGTAGLEEDLLVDTPAVGPKRRAAAEPKAASEAAEKPAAESKPAPGGPLPAAEPAGVEPPVEGGAE